MFTGISTELGKIQEFRQKSDHVEVKISCREVLEDLKLGDSIMTDGVCLTVKEYGPDYYKADLMKESLDKTKFSPAILGKYINLERALRFSDRLDGHIVQGHVDGIGKLIGINKNVYRFKTDRKICKYIVNKGSVCIDGISLTVSAESAETFEVSLIPETIANTNFKYKKIGDAVNIETDIIGRFVEKLYKNNSKEDLGLILGLN